VTLGRSSSTNKRELERMSPSEMGWFHLRGRRGMGRSSRAVSKPKSYLRLRRRGGRTAVYTGSWARGECKEKRDIQLNRRGKPFFNDGGGWKIVEKREDHSGFGSTETQGKRSARKREKGVLNRISSETQENEGSSTGRKKRGVWLLSTHLRSCQWNARNWNASKCNTTKTRREKNERPGGEGALNHAAKKTGRTG